MLLIDEDREATLSDSQWVLAEPLFVKWGYAPEGATVKVRNLDDVLPELSAWGIPWKWR